MSVSLSTPDRSTRPEAAAVRGPRRRARVATGGLAAALVVLLAGCAGTADAGDDHTAAHTTQAEDFGIHDVWAKSATVADGMTAVFGDMHTHAESGLRITAASSDAAAVTEFHEMVDGGNGMVMRKIEAPYQVPAGADTSLAPGGDHIMLLQLTRDLLPGDTVTIELTFSDGSTTSFDAVVKEFAGANESYDEGHGMAGH